MAIRTQDHVNFTVAPVAELIALHEKAAECSAVNLAQRAAALIEVTDLYTRYNQLGGFLKTRKPRHGSQVIAQRGLCLLKAAEQFSVAYGTSALIEAGSDPELTRIEEREVRSGFVRRVLGEDNRTNRACLLATWGNQK